MTGPSTTIPMNIQGHGVSITPSLRSYAEKKVEHLTHYFKNIQKIELNLEVNDIHDLDHCQVAEATLWVSGNIIRAEVGTGDLYASIDGAFDKIERQVIRYKDRLKAKDRSAIKHALKEGEAFSEGSEEEEQEAARPRLIRTKRFAIKPMPPEEAVEQMDLLGHSFFVFLNSETAKVNVVYVRKDGNVGLIEPDFS